MFGCKGFKLVSGIVLVQVSVLCCQFEHSFRNGHNNGQNIGKFTSALVHICQVDSHIVSDKGWCIPPCRLRHHTLCLFCLFSFHPQSFQFNVFRVLAEDAQTIIRILNLLPTVKAEDDLVFIFCISSYSTSNPWDDNPSTTLFRDFAGCSTEFALLTL